ncbi:MAG: packaging protein [Flavipsychrobacter sp.]|jgi:hypothetical protein|nr:packaging protein [Flavipsychrobacter sp.]
MPKPFEVGNQFWKLRTKHGVDKLFKDPQLLWEQACEYFEATDSRKWVKDDWVGKDAIKVERKNETPYTKSGLALYLDCDWRTIEALKEDTNKDFLHIITRIEQIIYTQKIEGASVGAFNPSIVARELGLAEKQEIDANVRAKNVSFE